MSDDLAYDSSRSDNYNIEALKEYFNITEKPAKVFTLRCKRCDNGWQLDARKRLHLGNVLHLLNHAHGHLAKKRR